MTVQETEDNPWKQIPQTDPPRGDWAASRTKNCFYSNFSYTQTTVRKKNRMKIVVAIARKILVAIWHMITKEEVSLISISKDLMNRRN